MVSVNQIEDDYNELIKQDENYQKEEKKTENYLINQRTGVENLN